LFACVVCSVHTRFVRPPIVAQSEESPIIDDAIIQKINNGPYSWTSARSPRFEGMTRAEAKRMMGTRIPSKEELLNTKKSQENRPLLQNVDLPVNYDSRQKYPNCKGMHTILNQGQCGSCWAFGSTEALSDLFCIQSNGTINTILSPETLVSCDDIAFGCDGGALQLAWAYLEEAGTVTLSCFPYTAGNGTVQSCESACVNNNEPYKKYYAASQWSYFGESEIQNAIYQYGAVNGMMYVFADFINYSGGVYTRQSDDLLGGHSIKFIGWGTDPKSGLDYWIAQNSWGTDWGIAGYFWIERGDCGTDIMAVTGTALLK